MDFMLVFNGVLSLSLIIFIGFLARKTEILNIEITKGLTTMLLNITLPLLIINSFIIDFTDDLKEKVYLSFLISFIIMLLSIFITKILLLPIKKENKSILQFGIVFSNCGFMAFPIVESLFGVEGVIYTSIFNMFFTIFIWTYGYVLFNNKKDDLKLSSILKKPAIIAVVVGIIIMIFSIKIPSILTNTFSIVGSMTTPLSMIIIGSILATCNIKSYLKDINIYYGSLIKLIVLPLIIGFILKFFIPLDSLYFTLILLVAMPSATMTTIFSENFNKDKEYASVFVFITTIFSIITIPIISYIISNVF